MLYHKTSLSYSPLSIKKKHPFKANMTTRKLYAGEHKVVLQINGQAYDEVIVIL